MEEFVRQTFGIETPLTQVEGGGLRQTQQEVSSVQERVFTRVDRGSVRGGSSDTGSGAYVRSVSCGEDHQT